MGIVGAALIRVAQSDGARMREERIDCFHDLRHVQRGVADDDEVEVAPDHQTRDGASQLIGWPNLGERCEQIEFRDDCLRLTLQHLLAGVEFGRVNRVKRGVWRR
jgi:hypothetical protein